MTTHELATARLKPGSWYSVNGSSIPVKVTWYSDDLLRFSIGGAAPERLVSTFDFFYLMEPKFLGYGKRPPTRRNQIKLPDSSDIAYLILGAGMLITLAVLMARAF